MRLIEPDAGDVVFDGDPVGDRHGLSVNAMRRQMQMVFQDSYSSLNPRMTDGRKRRLRAAHARPAGQGRVVARGNLLAQVGLNPRPVRARAIRTNCPAARSSG